MLEIIMLIIGFAIIIKSADLLLIVHPLWQ